MTKSDEAHPLMVWYCGLTQLGRPCIPSSHMCRQVHIGNCTARMGGCLSRSQTCPLDFPAPSHPTSAPLPTCKFSGHICGNTQKFFLPCQRATLTPPHLWILPLAICCPTFLSLGTARVACSGLACLNNNNSNRQLCWHTGMVHTFDINKTQNAHQRLAVYPPAV